MTTILGRLRRLQKHGVTIEKKNKMKLFGNQGLMTRHHLIFFYAFQVLL
jgi:hypothetical protein